MKSYFFILRDVTFLVRLQGKLETGHSWDLKDLRYYFYGMSGYLSKHRCYTEMSAFIQLLFVSTACRNCLKRRRKIAGWADTTAVQPRPILAECTMFNTSKDRE